MAAFFSSSRDFRPAQKDSLASDNNQNQFGAMFSITRSKLPSSSNRVYPPSSVPQPRTAVTKNLGKSSRVFGLRISIKSRWPHQDYKRIELLLMGLKPGSMSSRS